MIDIVIVYCINMYKCNYTHSCVIIYNVYNCCFVLLPMKSVGIISVHAKGVFKYCQGLYVTILLSASRVYINEANWFILCVLKSGSFHKESCSSICLLKLHIIIYRDLPNDLACQVIVQKMCAGKKPRNLAPPMFNLQEGSFQKLFRKPLRALNAYLPRIWSGYVVPWAKWVWIDCLRWSELLSPCAM